jgi:hypothetical protein
MLLYFPDGGIFNGMHFIPPSQALEYIPVAIENVEKVVKGALGVLAALGGGIALTYVGLPAAITWLVNLISKPGVTSYQGGGTMVLNEVLDWFTSGVTAQLQEWANNGSGYVMWDMFKASFAEWGTRGDFGFGVYPWIWITP